MVIYCYVVNTFDDVGELNSRGLMVKVKVVYDELLRCDL